MLKRVAYLCAVFCVISLTLGVTQTANAELLARWPLNEGVGTVVADVSGNGHDGTLVGTPDWVDDPDRGMVVSFGGGGDHIDTPVTIPAMDLENGFTWAFWCKQDGNGGGANMVVFGNRYGGTASPLQFIKFTPTRFEYYRGGHEGTIDYTDIPSDEWVHMATVKDGPNLIHYRNGVEDTTNTTSVEIDENPFGMGGDATNQTEYWTGSISDGALFTIALTEELIQSVMAGGGLSPELASSPGPENEIIDVPRDVTLAWNPGKFAVKHNVYLGTTWDDANDASLADPLGTVVGQDLTDTGYAAGILAYGQTYYWRADEVNSAPDNTVFKGEVWSFTVEPFSYPLTNVTASASSFNAGMGPELTIDGSGLNELDQHSTLATEMWLSGMGDANPWIQYDFDGAYRLDQLWVWNSNQMIESFIGLGAKDVVIETSLDGAEWTVLEGATLFNQATGAADYTANTIVEFGGVLAQSVRITVTAGYGILPQYGLSEVRFYFIPTYAREPQPVDGAVLDSADVELVWRAGRESASSEIYLGTDAADLALLGTSTGGSLMAEGLNYSTTYYWSVTEVNEAEDPTAYASDTWSFTTPDYGTVDDFDQYDDVCNRIFFAWEDGLGHSGGEDVEGCDVPPSNGNGGGSIVGNDQAPFAERTIVNVGSTQSLPFNYDNSFGDSYATLTLDVQDWTASGVQTLAIAFSGTAGNTGTLYVEINNNKVQYDRDPADIGRSGWQAWNIDLTGLNGLQNVTSLTIGVDGANAAGMLYIDDIRLYPLAGELITPTDPGNAGLLAQYTFEGNFEDSSGNGRHGTVVGNFGTTIEQDPIRGHVLSLPGGDDQFVEVGAVGISGTMPRTIACWAKADDTSIPDWTLIFGFTGQADGTGGNGSHFNIGSLGGPGGIGAHCWGWEETMVSDEAGLDWHHYAMTYDGTTIQYFVNGMHLDTDPAKSNVRDLSSSADRVHIGTRVTQTSSFPGDVDDAVIYDRVLSPEEILWLADRTEAVHKSF